MLNPGRYILDAKGEPIPETDLLKWGKWLETGNRRVADETVGNVRVSTVFLGLDMNFSGDGDPVLWETMTFGVGIEQQQNRCGGSREQAEAMHAEMVAKVKADQLKQTEGTEK